MDANARLTKDHGKLKAQPPALTKDEHNKVTQLFNYFFSPDLLSELSARLHAGIMASLEGILEFFKACSTQTPGKILLDRISRLELTTAAPSLHMAGLSGFNSLSLTPPAKLANTADLQAQLNTLEAQFTSFREENDNTKVGLGGTGSNASFESSTRKSRYDSPEAALAMESFRYTVLEVFTGGKIREGSMDGFRYKLQTGLDDVVETIRCVFRMPRPSPQTSSFIGCVRPATKIAKNPTLPPPRKTDDMSPTVSKPYSSTFTRPRDGFSNHLVAQTVLNEHMQHWAVMQDELNTHLLALKKEQEAVMKKEHWSLKSRVDKQETEEMTLVGVVSEIYPTWLWYVGLSANALWLNSLSEAPGHGPEDWPWTKLDVGAPTTDLPPGPSENSQEERSGNELPAFTMGYYSWVGKQVLHSSPMINLEASRMGAKASAKKFIERMATMVKKEEKDIPATPELPGYEGRVNWTRDERVLDALIDHETMGKVLAGVVWFFGSDPTQTSSPSTREEQQNSLPLLAQVISRSNMSSTPSLYQGVAEASDLEAGFDAKTLKAKAEDRANAIMDKATKSDNAAVPKHFWNGKIAEALSQMTTSVLELPIAPNLRKYCRVDLSQLLDSAPDESRATGVWMCNTMGLKSSPYHSVQGSLWAHRIILGNPWDPKNSYTWDWMRLNLPGMESDDPTKAWISKLQSDGLHAADITQYVDDVHITDRTEDLAWNCSNKMAKDKEIQVRSQAHWQVLWYPPTMDESVRVSPKIDGPIFRTKYHTKAGCLDLEAKSENNGMYVAMTYTSMVPYLKGLYLTLNSWRWATPLLQQDKFIPPKGDPPFGVCNKEAFYVVGDAFESGFGSSTWKSKERKIHTEFGAWEAANLVESLKRKVGSGIILRGLKAPSFENGNERQHFVWISGNQMICQGTEGLSRGDFTSGAMVEEAFLRHHKRLDLKQKETVRMEHYFDDWFHIVVFTDPEGAWVCPPHCQGSFGAAKQTAAPDAQITFVKGSTICPNEMYEPITFALFAPPLLSSRKGQISRVTNIIVYGTWHPECISQVPGDQFSILLACDLDNCLVDDELMEDNDTQRFKNPGDGDSLLTRYFDYQVHLGTEVSCLPPLGPMPPEDSWGMKVACAMLLRSQDQGCNALCVQFETTRKCCSAFTNSVHTCPEGVGAYLTLQGRGCGFVSTSVANSLWFNQFTTRCHCGMGDVWLPDTLVTLEIMDAALHYMEEKWEAMEDSTSWEMFDFAPCAVMFLLGLYGGLGREEICRMSSSGINHYWDQSTDMNKEIGTRCKRRNIFEWFERMRDCGEIDNINWYATIADLDWPFHDILKVVQRCHALLIDSSVVVEDACSAYRSFRRGVASVAQNARLAASTISANNHWRSQMSRMSSIWDYTNKLVLGYFTYWPTIDKGLCGISQNDPI
eukprot:jgi/Psemu1/9200/gm1.9200_g